MAQILEALPKRRGARQVHPWEEWSDGKIRKITQGTDFEAGLESMRTQLYGKARRLGKRLELVVDDDEGSISFRMYDA